MFCATRGEAQELGRVFGGMVQKLARDWEAKALAASKTKPLAIGRRLVVASDVADVDSSIGAARLLIIPAGAAFGTGDHATTAMSLRMLERLSRRFGNGWSLFDAGTGSGILALAAKIFGAREVIALDNDPRAIATAKANARDNGIAGVKFRVGDATGKPPGVFNVITANLYSELLVAALPQWRESLHEDGCLILSGVMRAQESALLWSLRRNQFGVLEMRRRGKWIALLCSQKRG